MSFVKKPVPPINPFDARGLFAASNLSAALPCLSPLESFLNAY